jgi:hypothetical protein
LDGGSARSKATTYTGQHKQNKGRQTSMLSVGFESTISVFDQAKTVHALDRAATVIGIFNLLVGKYCLHTIKEETIFGELDLDGRMVLNCILKKYVRRFQTELIQPSS